MSKFAVRQFCPHHVRRDCWEVYLVETGACLSFGMTKRDALATVKKMNEVVLKMKHDTSAILAMTEVVCMPLKDKVYM